MTKSTAVSGKVRDLRGEFAELRQFMTEEELAEMDRLLWNPSVELDRYKVDPVAFCAEVLQMKLTPYQERALSMLARRRRLCIRGPRGLGKTTLAAAAILWFIGTREECKIATITGVWRQLTEFLWPEVHKWAIKAQWWRVGLQVRKDKELFGTKVEINKNRMAFAMASDDAEKIEGAHADSVLVVFDEAKIIPENVWDSAEGVLTTEDAFALAISTPGDSIGRFYDIQMRKPGFEDWATMAVTIEEAIEAGRVQQDWVKQRAASWGVKSVMYRRQVKGEFAEDDAETIIPFEAILIATSRWEIRQKQLLDLIASGVDGETAEQQVWGAVTVIGVDPARFGPDKTGYSFRYGPNGIRNVERTYRQDTMETAAKTAEHLDEHPTAKAIIDANGLGAGTYDKLHKDDYNVVALQTGTKTKLRDSTNLLQFADTRSWLWWAMREELLNPASEFCLPPDDELMRDLLSGKLIDPSAEKLRVIDKDKMRALLGRSPDVGEACLYTIYPDIPPYKPMVKTF